MNIENEITATIARLSAGEDPRTILKAFAKAVREPGQVTMEREVCKCSGCGTLDAVCFKCKAVSLVGEQGLAAAPLLLAKLGPMVSKWAQERKAKKAAQGAARAAEEAAEARTRAQSTRRTPPPPAGPQRF
jgi:hypothetical protein